jgi:hypothetical protein
MMLEIMLMIKIAQPFSCSEPIYNISSDQELIGNIIFKSSHNLSREVKNDENVNEILIQSTKESEIITIKISHFSFESNIIIHLLYVMNFRHIIG